MTDLVTLQRFVELASNGYIPSVGAWVQIDPANNLTTVLNAFNTLGDQSLELFLLNQSGYLVGAPIERTLERHKALRLDLEAVVDAANLPFEGSLWVWALGEPREGHLGLQAIDLDFVDRTRPAGHVLGSVHLIFDFINTLGIPPYLDLLSPRVLVEETPEGAQRYRNFLGLAQVPVSGDAALEPARLEIRLSNEAGETRTAEQVVQLPTLGSWFGDLNALFGDFSEFLRRDGERRGYGVVNVREKNDTTVGMAGMIKVVDTVSGEMLVDHLNDRHFARPAMKDER